jgi:hypothetical protein
MISELIVKSNMLTDLRQSISTSILTLENNMEIGLILSAALIGFSFSNTFMCTAIALSTSLGKGFKASAGFVIGRILGVIGLGVFLALFGFYVEIDTQIMLYIFGGLTIVFGLVILIFPGISTKFGLLKNCEAGICDDCDKEHGGETDDGNSHHDCSSCSSSSNCSSSKEHNVDGKRKRPLSRFTSKLGSFGLLGIITIGLIRGATPCLKIILLLPLIISLPFLESITITSTYALSSSLYPIMGIAIASIIGNFSPQKITKYLVKIGAVSMIGIGIYFLYKAWNYTCQTGI